jgi:hypothetical protein
VWGRLPLAGLLLAGCSFSPGGSSGSDPDSDAGGGFSDGLPDPDGGPGVPDAAPLPDAPPVEPVLLETLTVESNGNTVQSSFALEAGATYRLVASGELVVRDDDAGRFSGDADYWYGVVLSGDGFDGVDFGVAIDDTEVDDERSPDWGEFADSHIYQATIPGTGAQLTAQYHDNNYGNGNSGSMSLEIWGPPL